MQEFEVAGHQYRSGKLDAFKQLHVARKLAPLIAKLTPNVQKSESFDFFTLMAPVIDGLAEMPEDDVNYITQRCLSVVQRQSGNAWAPIWSDSARRMMFEDIDALQLLQITFHVVQDNLGHFINAPLSTSSPPSPTDTGLQENLFPFQTAKIG